jgi:uncharacterized protein
MKFVIAGATGLIGKALVRNLIDSQHSVVVLSRNPQLVSPQSPLLQAVRWDGKSGGQWMRQLEGADAVVNFSGESLGSRRWTAERKRRLFSSRIEPTTALVDALKVVSPRPKALLNASAVGYYGPVENGDVTEDHPAGSDYLGQLCVQWEQAAEGAQQLGVRLIVFRSGVVLDPHGGALVRMLLPFRLFAGGPLGTGDQWFPWIHKVDEIRALRFLLEHGTLSGPFNLAAPESATMREFSTELGRAMRRPSVVKVPAVVLRTLLGEMAGMVLTGQRVIPKRLLDAGFTFTFPSLKAALEDLLR